MDKINFANKKNQYKAVWSPKVSLTLFLIVFIIMLIMQIRQWTTVRTLKKKRTHIEKELAPLEKTLQEKKELIEQKNEIKKRLEKIQKIQSNPHVQLNLFSKINELLGSMGSLEFLHIDRKKIDLTICCPDVKKANQMMQSITELPSISFLDLISIRPHSGQLLFNMSGKLS